MMKAKVIWHQKMNFTAQAGANSITIDDTPPLGGGEGMTPKQLVAVGMAGCTAMDVISLLKKFKQNVTSFSVEVETQKSDSGHPVVFTEALLVYNIDGKDLDSEKIKECVELSQTKYCGVSAMLSKAFPINYRVIVNHEEIFTGQANFSL